MDLVAEGCTVAIGRKVLFDGGEAVVAQFDRGAVVSERRRERPIIETHTGRPSLMLERSVRSVAPYHRVT